MDNNDGSLDIIIYGASGFTGKMAVKYLCELGKEDSAGSKLSVGFSGRNKDKLDALAVEVSSGEGKNKYSYIVCNTSLYEDCETLMSYLKPTGVICSFANSSIST